MALRRGAYSGWMSTNVRPCAIPSAIARSNGMRSRIGRPASRTECVHRRVADTIPVDHDPGRDAQLGCDLGGQAQVVQPEGGRLGDQQQVVGPAHGFDHGTRGARRRVEDHHAAFRPIRRDRPLLELADRGCRHRLAHVQHPAAQTGCRGPPCPLRARRSRAVPPLIAPSGQTRVQLPQPWHNCEKTRVRLPSTAMAWYWQTSAHLPQAVHFAASTCGIWIATSWRRSKAGARNRCALGPSTSQSRKTGGGGTGWPGSPIARLSARLVATVVLPVPPLPLATAMRRGEVTPPLRPGRHDARPRLGRSPAPACRR